MKCPFCGFSETKVVDKRVTEDLESNRRRRECLKCGKRFTTYERIESTNLMVVKKDGNREQFDREKITKGILKACEKRPVSVESIERMVNEIEKELRGIDEREVPTEVIGNLVMERLKIVDDVAYIRFASVYRSFSDLKSFERELRAFSRKPKGSIASKRKGGQK